MPVTSSAKKALRVDRRRTQVNKVIRTNVRSIIDKVKKAQDPGLLPQAYSIIDRASKKNVIHKNKAARLKSKLSQLVRSNAPADNPPAAPKTKPVKKPASKSKKATTSTKTA